MAWNKRCRAWPGTCAEVQVGHSEQHVDGRSVEVEDGHLELLHSDVQGPPLQVGHFEGVDGKSVHVAQHVGWVEVENGHLELSHSGIQRPPLQVGHFEGVDGRNISVVERRNEGEAAERRSEGEAVDSEDEVVGEIVRIVGCSLGVDKSMKQPLMAGAAFIRWLSHRLTDCELLTYGVAVSE